MLRCLTVVLVSAIVGSAVLAAQTAVVECVASVQLGGRAGAKELAAGGSHAAVFDFRFAAIDGWSVRKAYLYLHPRDRVPATLQIAAAGQRWRESAPPRRLPGWREFRVLPVEPLPGGWGRVALPAALVETARQSGGFVVRDPKNRGFVVHGRHALGYAPSLLVEGRLRR